MAPCIYIYIYISLYSRKHKGVYKINKMPHEGYKEDPIYIILIIIRYLLPLANLAAQTEFSQWEKVCSG